MDNQETVQQGFELPKPQTDAMPLPTKGTPEVGAHQEQMTASVPSQDPAAVQSTAPTNQAIVDDASVNTDQTTVQTANIAAADIDLIEKEWVLKAKAIVVHTHGDPYKQNKEINKIKADYIKKRYNKDIKQVSE